jgi:hypothetical protein
VSGFDIATGQAMGGSSSPPQDHPAVANVTPAYPAGPAPADQMPVAGTTGQQQERLTQGRGAVTSAQTAGQDAKAALNAKYEADMMPMGASYGDEIALPDVVSDWSKHTGGSDARSYDPAG